MLRYAAFLLPALVLLGCDSRDSATVSRTRKTLTLELRSILSLRANQRTQLAIGTGSQLYFVQPDTALPSLQRLEANGEVRPTAMTAARVGELLGETETPPALRAIESLGDGRIVGYFSGTSRQRSLSCVVVYEPLGDRVRIAVSPEDMARDSGMGMTVDLAEAQFARTGHTLWLWLRHVDQSAFLTLDTRALGAGTGRLAKPFEQLKTDDGPLKFAPSDVLKAQQDETLWLLRPTSGELWRLSRDGQAFGGKQPENRPRMSVAPILLRTDERARDETWLYFFPAEELTAGQEAPRTRDENLVRYPAIASKSKADEWLVDRDHLEVRPAFPRHALRFTQWVLEPATGDVLAYDGMSGEVFRISARLK